MFSRVLYVGPSPYGRASFSYRVQETLRLLGHAVQVCPDPCEESRGHDALFAMLQSFSPTLVLWDVSTVDPTPFREALDEAPCCVAGLCFGPEGGGPRTEAGTLDALVIVSLEPGATSGLVLPARPDRRYEGASISDETESQHGALVFGHRSPDGLGAIRSALPNGASGRVELASDILSRPGANFAFEARTFELALYPSDSPVPGDADVAMRLAEGLTVLVEGDVGCDVLTPSSKAGEALRTTFPGRLQDALSAMGAARGLMRAGEAMSVLSLDDTLPALLERLDAVAADHGKPAVLACAERARLVMAYGWFGAHNYGDDLLLRLVKDRLEGRYANVQVAALGADAQALRCEFGLEAVTPDEKDAAGRLLSWSSALVYCGGLIFDQPMARTAGPIEFMLDPWHEPSCQADFALAAAAYGAAPIMLGIGAGPVTKSATRYAVRLMGLAGTLFLARDANTADLLLGAGAPSDNVRVAADLVLGARPYVDAHRGEPPSGCPRSGYFVVSLRRWPGTPEGFEASVATALDRIAMGTGLSALFLPFDEDDVEIHREVAGLMRAPLRPTVLGDRPDEGALLGCIGGSEFAVAMRLHCSVLHHVLGKPSFGLSYNDKIAAYFDAVGQGDTLFPLAFDVESLVRSVMGVRECRTERAAAILDAVSRKSAVVDGEFDELFSAIDNAGSPGFGQAETLYPRTSGSHEIRSRELERENSALRSRLDVREREVLALRDSTSFRLGNALISPLAAIRGLLAR